MTGWAADFSSAQLSADQLIVAGYQGAVRYITGAGKQIAPPELHDLTTTPGMALALVNETYAQAAGGGYAVGRAEAQAAFTRADQLGWPPTRPIYFVLEDPHSVPPPWSVLEEYLRGVLTVVPLARVGDYGSARQIAHMQAIGLTTYGWAVQTWPGDHTGCHLIQMYSPVPGAPSNLGGAVDPNMILQADWGQWSTLTPDPVSDYSRLSGQEDGPMNANTAPDGLRQDMVMIGTDGHLYHAWSNSNGAFDPARLEDRGPTPTGRAWQQVSATYRKDGIYTVYAVDEAGRIWTTRSDGQTWIQLWTPVNPTWVVASPPAGAAGPKGDPGPAGGTYDDSWRAKVADAVRPVK